MSTTKGYKITRTLVNRMLFGEVQMLSLLRQREYKWIAIVYIVIMRHIPTETSVASKQKPMFTFNDSNVGAFVITFSMKAFNCVSILTGSVKKLSLERFFQAN